MYIATTRFNEKTKTENINFKTNHGIQKGSVIYNVPLPIRPKLNKGVFLFVIEMNNEKNTIFGISVIKNYLWFDKTKYRSPKIPESKRIAEIGMM